jgi:hypothetical protein
MNTKISVSVLALALALGGCGGSNSTTPQPDASISAQEQTANPANHVVVTEVVALSAGWLVIHESDGATFGPVIGHAAAPKGTSHNLAVTLSRDVIEGETLYAMLHVDAGQAGVFEFPGVDVPATDRSNDIVMRAFVVHLPGVITASITAANQTLSQLSTVVTVSAATSDGPGWAVIHESVSGAPGAILGHAHLNSGPSANVVVTLDRPAVGGEELIAMLHVDAGAVGTFEFPGVDIPAVDGQSQTIMQAFTVSVASGTPAVRLHVTNVGFSAWSVSSVEPAAFAGIVSGGDNPTLTLRSGWRYEIDNPVRDMHPFELLHMGAGPGSDVVLLSEATTGSMEGDAGIAWTDQAGALNLSRFTVSPSLAAQLTGYRCGIHTSTMRGPIAVQ